LLNKSHSMMPQSQVRECGSDSNIEGADAGADGEDAAGT
jgi:hypothetical protein